MSLYLYADETEFSRPGIAPGDLTVGYGVLVCSAPVDRQVVVDALADLDAIQTGTSRSISSKTTGLSIAAIFTRSTTPRTVTATFARRSGTTSLAASPMLWSMQGTCLSRQVVQGGARTFALGDLS